MRTLSPSDQMWRVLVDGTGLPAHVRSRCTHTVAWYARALADTFRDALSHTDIDIRTALTLALRQVAASRGTGCDLDRGWPQWHRRRPADRSGGGGVPRAWRRLRRPHRPRPGSQRITDDRIATVTQPIIASRMRDRVATGPASTPNDLRGAPSAAVELTRNRVGGFLAPPPRTGRRRPCDRADTSPRSGGFPRRCIR